VFRQARSAILWRVAGEAACHLRQKRAARSAGTKAVDLSAAEWTTTPPRLRTALLSRVSALARVAGRLFMATRVSRHHIIRFG
jgi:hypothetical protein